MATLDLPPGEYVSVAWLPDGALYATVSRSGPQGRIGEELLRIDDGEVAVVDVPNALGCLRHSVSFLSALPDGRLGYALECGDAASVIPDWSLRALDTRTGEAQELARVGFLPHGYTFAPDLERGIATESSAICSQMVGLEDGVSRPLDLEIEAGGVSMNLAHQPAEATIGCDGFGRAAWATWSPDGETVAFFASPQSKDLEGTSRLDAPWTLFTWDIATNAVHEALTGVDSAYGLLWSPDGTRLAFSADSYDRRTGTFVYTPSSGDIQQVAEEPIFSLSWASDGTQLAGRLNYGTDPETSVVVLPVTTPESP